MYFAAFVDHLVKNHLGVPFIPPWQKRERFLLFRTKRRRLAVAFLVIYPHLTGNDVF
jgi:hypothetical protein